MNSNSIFLSTLVLLLGVTWLSPAFGKPYKGAELYSFETALYGKFVMRMRTAPGSGLISNFFTYKDGSEQSGVFWEEIDIEVFGQDGAQSWQSNIITGFDPRTLNEEVHAETFSFADTYNTFTLEWTPDYIAWFVNDNEVRRVTETNPQISALTNPQSMRFNLWQSTNVAWVGPFDDKILPVYMYVNWFEYHAWNGTEFVLAWRDDFDTFEAGRWGRANWTFDGNGVDFDPDNLIVQDGTLILALTREGETGFSGTVPIDSEVTVNPEPEPEPAPEPEPEPTPEPAPQPQTPAASSGGGAFGHVEMVTLLLGLLGARRSWLQTQSRR